MTDFLMVVFYQIFLTYEGIAIYIFINEVMAFRSICKQDKQFNEKFSESAYIKPALYLTLWGNCVAWPFYYDIIPKYEKYEQ